MHKPRFHHPPPVENGSESGFTLVELSIVLVIIGLIVGGVLVGQNLIHAAGVRSTITQIQKFQTAASTFQGKYGFLPGDIKDPEASNFGFAARGPYAGEGDGDGFLNGIICNTGNCTGPHAQAGGENPMFWVDLSAARLIDGGFSTATPSTIPSITLTATSNPSLAAFFPEAKLGRGNYFYTWSGAFNYGGGNGAAFNFFGLSSVSFMNGGIVSAPWPHGQRGLCHG